MQALVGKRLGAGGEGAVYQDASRPDYVLKIMHAPTAQSEAKARAMLAFPPAAQAGQYQGRDLIQIAWPQELLTDDRGGYIGFSMRYLDMSQTVGLTVWMIPRERRLNQLSEDDRLRVHLAANLSSVTNYVNMAGHNLIDLKPLNVLAYRQDGYLCLVDCDGFCIQSNGVAFPASAYTPDYLAPEYQVPTFKPDQCGEEQDRFALAVIVYELLDNGIHPFSGVDRANVGQSYVLSTRIQQQRTFLDGASGLEAHKSSHHRFFADDTLALFLRAFTGPADQRPSSGEWKTHLEGLARYRMKPCHANRDHWEYGKGCPWCLSKPVQIAPPRQTGNRQAPRIIASAATAGASAATPAAYSSLPAAPAGAPGASAGPGWSGAAPVSVPTAGGASFAAGAASVPTQSATAPPAWKSMWSAHWRAVCGVLAAVVLLVVAARAVIRLFGHARLFLACFLGGLFVLFMLSRVNKSGLRLRHWLAVCGVLLGVVPLAVVVTMAVITHQNQQAAEKSREDQSNSQFEQRPFNPMDLLKPPPKEETGGPGAPGNQPVALVLANTLKSGADDVMSLAFSPDGRLLASGHRHQTIKLWDVASVTEVRSLGELGLTVAFSPDGRMLASGGGMDNKIHLWDVATGAEMSVLVGRSSPLFSHPAQAFSVAFSPDGRVLASGNGDDTIQLWDVASGTELRTLAGHTDSVMSVAFSPDGRMLASGSFDHLIKLWDVAGGRELRTLAGHTDSVQRVAFSPDGRMLASGSDDHTIKIWDVANATELRTLAGHGDQIWSLTFSPDGRVLASGSLDHSLKLWNPATGAELGTYPGQESAATALAFSPDGRLLASGGENTIKLWNVTGGVR